MSQEEEFSKWLRRKEKSFEENLKFAIKSWQSVEFTLTTKYELILQWLSEQNQLTNEQIVEEDFKELLKLRAQPGLIAQNVKKEFVKWFLQQAKEKSNECRKWCNLLQLLVEFEILQDLYRMNYDLQSEVYAEIFHSYEKYLWSLQQSDKQFLSTFETEFFAAVLKGLKETIKRCGDVVLYEKSFTKIALKPLAQVLLVLRVFKVDFFEELMEIENLMCNEMEDSQIFVRLSKLDLPVRLLCIECSLVKRRGVESYLKNLLDFVFTNFLGNSANNIDPALSLTLAAYVLEMCSRHDVGLNLQINEQQNAVKFLGTRIFKAVQERKETHLKEVLMLLCAALRLNPLILEQNVFEITAWMILATKSGDMEEQELFEEYLVLLMDMFRRLSRAEKFVTNLLKALKENLKHYDLSLKKKRKAKMELEETPSKKKKKYDNDSAVKKDEEFSKYLRILFQDFFKPSLTKTLNDNSKLSATTSFTKLQNFWPSNPVGLSFSKIITGLVSKPSLTIWKSLLYALKYLIESLKDSKEINENSLFQLDFQAALLSQYFAGSKLAEQSDKFLTELQQQREFTLDVLKLFGEILLAKEHEPRTMSAFLELTYYASNFELLLTYYRPDGCQHDTLQPLNTIEKLHSFLTPEEWTLIQQRVLNFGKSSCKHLLHRLKMQKAEASLLLLTSGEKESLPLKNPDPEILNSLLKTSQAKWYLQQLSRPDKVTISQYFLNKPDLLHLAFEDLELLEFVSLAIYENICQALNSKHSLLKSLACDFDKIRQCSEISACELLIKELIEIVISKAEQEYKVKKLDVEEIKRNLDLLSAMPLGQLRRQRKTIIFALHLCLYRDLKAAQEEELALQTLEILKDLLHFGQQVLIFKYLPISLILKLLPADNCWELYEFLFSSVKHEEKGTEQFLQGLVDILQESQSTSHINEEQRKLLLAAIETLSGLSGPSAKHMRKYLDMFLKIFSNYLQGHFSEGSDGTSKKDKKFVQKTLAGFAPYAANILGKAQKAKEGTKKEGEGNESKKEEGDESKKEGKDESMKDGVDETKKKEGDESKETDGEEKTKKKGGNEYREKEESDSNTEVDEDFRRISKIYIGHSMDYRNPHAIRLMQVALNHRELLHLDQDEIEFVLTNYWTQIKEDLKESCSNQELEQEKLLGSKTIESAVKMIIGNKTNEDLLLILKTIGHNMEETNFPNILRLLTLIAKCPFSTIKGAIFNEQYKQITFNITLRLKRDEQQNFVDYDLVVKLLNCHQAVLDNKMIPISTDTMDSILAFLMDINIKKFRLSDTNLKVFNNLHLAMTEVCGSLIKYRHILLMDRVPQYMHIFKDLLQSIVWYKSDRQKDTALPSEEIDDLSELALKLEALMHLIAQHRVGVKRVAPFVLTFIINLMVANKRPTTLYNKIKTHIENICYELVGICDHRVGRFILRCSNEAGRQLYELLVKDYQKYHKFKGKV